jgi:hypothetical protein
MRVFEEDGSEAGGRWHTVPVSTADVYGDLWGLGFEPERLMFRRFAASLDGGPQDLDLELSLNISLAGVAAVRSGEEHGTPIVLAPVVSADPAGSGSADRVPATAER